MTMQMNLEKIMVKLVRIFIYGIIAFSLVSFLVCLTVYLKKYPYIFSSKELIWVIAGALLLVGVYFVGRWYQRKKEWQLVLSMIGIEGLFSFLMIATYNTQPVSDYSLIWDAANAMASNRFIGGTDPTNYMYFYNWQIGIAAFESVLIRLFGANFTVFKVINSLFVIGIDYCTYLLCKKRYGYKVGCYAYVLAAAYMPWVLAIPQLTNHHIGFFFLFLALWLLDKNKWYAWLIGGVSIGVLNVIRPMGIILVLTAVCMTVYSLVKAPGIKHIIRLFLCIAAYMLVISLFDQAFISLGYAEGKVSEAQIPYFKFQKGLYGYNEPKELPEYDYDYDAYNAAMKEELKETVLNDLPGTVVFIANKMVRYLGLFDYQFEMTYNHDVDFYTRYPVKALYSISWFQYIGVLGLAIVGLKKFLAVDEGINVYHIFFIGNTLVYIFIEAFSSYRFESYFLLIIMAALGLDYVDKKIRRQGGERI